MIESFPVSYSYINSVSLNAILNKMYHVVINMIKGIQCNKKQIF